MDKKILILGIGHSQVDLIKAAKKLNMKVFACAGSSNGPGYNLVHEFKEIDIKNAKAIKEYAIEKNVDLIYSVALESALPAITKVSEELNLPTFVSSENLLKINNKGVWRQELGNMDGNVKFQIGSKINDFSDWTMYPSYIKPVDSSGQRGVFKVNNFEEVKNVFEKSIKFSHSNQVIIEQSIDGPEISVNSFMHKGKLKVAIVSDRVSYTEYPGGIIKEHHIPSRKFNLEIENKAKKLVEKVNNKIGLDNGHIYYQMKVENGEPKIVEFTPRFDGCHMWRLIKHSHGIDLMTVALEVLAYDSSEMLEEFNTDKEPIPHITKFISDEPGTIVRREKYTVDENTEFLTWYYKNNEKIKSVTGYMEKVGYYIIKQ